MGKLHSLKREVKRDPDKWRGKAAYRGSNGKWYPIHYSPYMNNNSYRKFIQKIFMAL